MIVMFRMAQAHGGFGRTVSLPMAFFKSAHEDALRNLEMVKADLDNTRLRLGDAENARIAALRELQVNSLGVIPSSWHCHPPQICITNWLQVALHVLSSP
jgi:hypothetical protein